MPGQPPALLDASPGDDEPPTPAIPLPRLRLAVSPDALVALALILDRVTVGGSSETYVPVLKLAVTMLTGGAVIITDPDLPGGSWALYADGVILMRGTVEL